MRETPPFRLKKGQGILHPSLVFSCLFPSLDLIRNTLSTAGNSMTSSERFSPESCLQKGGVPSSTEGERIPEMLWRLQMSWEPARPLQRSLAPSGPEMPKKSRKCLENVSRGLRPRTPHKVSKKSRGQSGKSPESLRRVSGKCLESVFGVFRDFLETFWGSRGLRPRETFSRLFRHFGPGGPERPL